MRNAEEAENTGYVVSAASDGHFLGQGIDILPGCGQVIYFYNNIGCGRTDYEYFFHRWILPLCVMEDYPLIIPPSMEIVTT